MRFKHVELFSDKLKTKTNGEYIVISKCFTTAEVTHNECGGIFRIDCKGFLNSPYCTCCGKGVFKNINDAKRRKRGGRKINITARINRIQMSHEEFVKKVYSLVGEEYIVKSRYTGTHGKVNFFHVKCQREYATEAKTFLNGARCRHCKGLILKTTDQYIQEIFQLVGSEYNVLGKYIGANKKIKIIHTTCGNEYEIQAKSFLQGKRCPYCSGVMLKDTDKFKQEVFDLLGNEYAVIGEYQGCNLKIKMLHNECGRTFDMTPNHFLRGERCSNCRESKGERAIFNHLRHLGIDFKREHRIAECKNKIPLPFDFALFKDRKLKCLIEFDGKQHFEAAPLFGGIESMRQLQVRDKIKTNYCTSSKIPLIRIPYDVENIENYLDLQLSKLKVVEA